MLVSTDNAGDTVYNAQTGGVALLTAEGIGDDTDLNSFDAAGLEQTSTAYRLSGAVYSTTVFSQYDADGNVGHVKTTEDGVEYDYAYSYRTEGDSVVTNVIGAADPGGQINTTYNYNVAGDLTSTVNSSSLAADVNLVDNDQGEVLWRQSSTENSSGIITGHVENSVIVDGQYLGGTGDATLDSEAAAAGTLPFSLSFTPVSGAGAPQSTGPSTYIVSSGDTLESIAKSAYGDASLWTDIASANGLSDNSVLTPGEVLIIPNQAQLNINGAQTYKPYNATTAEGINGPQVPNPGGASSGCGVAGELLIVAIQGIVGVPSPD